MDFKLLGVIVFAMGMMIFVFGKQFILIRAYFGDRSMFAQMFWGTVVAGVGLLILYATGTFE
ncbi:hypothetical protein LNP00_04085 [Fructobacillus sp. M158]|uniref:hypothetical protein n=1 Tax=Fructobacillus parabroussonetiae TaxID=2713174 RepID=UPI00200B173C|nr:hypothetical protein [Fructobacillus parabroussonetiae]MCK8617542.1 hypothetical protein [Fructobacillus parabroussonetiae]